VLLLYFYLSSAVLLFGAEINAVIEHHSDDGKEKGEKTPGDGGVEGDEDIQAAQAEEEGVLGEARVVKRPERRT